MEKDLKKDLENMRLDNVAMDVFDYFTNDFAYDYDKYEKDIKYESQLEVLSFLNDEFIDIDTDYYDSPDFEDRVFAVIDRAIEMLEQKGDNHGER